MDTALSASSRGRVLTRRMDGSPPGSAHLLSPSLLQRMDGSPPRGVRIPQAIYKCSAWMDPFQGVRPSHC